MSAMFSRCCSFWSLTDLARLQKVHPLAVTAASQAAFCAAPDMCLMELCTQSWLRDANVVRLRHRANDIIDMFVLAQ